jgi:hypothetical protein
MGTPRCGAGAPPRTPPHPAHRLNHGGTPPTAPLTRREPCALPSTPERTSTNRSGSDASADEEGRPCPRLPGRVPRGTTAHLMRAVESMTRRAGFRMRLPRVASQPGHLWGTAQTAWPGPGLASPSRAPGPETPFRHPYTAEAKCTATQRSSR